MTMRTTDYKNHMTFGGKHNLSDYNSNWTTYPCDIAAKIVSDMKFDEQCKKNAIARENRILEENQN